MLITKVIVTVVAILVLTTGLSFAQKPPVMKMTTEIPPGITPAMAKKIIGKGSKYAYTYLDADGNPLDGSKTYKVNVPPNVPAKDFWSFTIYDNQTRSMLQTDERFPGIDNNKSGIMQNSDGSYDIYFGPKAPQGKKNNWVQTVPGKGWNTIFRLYGPLEPWFNKTWRPGEVELVQ